MVAGSGFEQEIPAYMYDGCRVLRGHGNYVLSVTQLRDGRIASGSWDKTIRVWDISKADSDPGYCRVLRGHGNIDIGISQL